MKYCKPQLSVVPKKNWCFFSVLMNLPFLHGIRAPNHRFSKDCSTTSGPDESTVTWQKPLRSSQSCRIFIWDPVFVAQTFAPKLHFHPFSIIFPHFFWPQTFGFPMCHGLTIPGHLFQPLVEGPSTWAETGLLEAEPLQTTGNKTWDSLDK